MPQMISVTTLRNRKRCWLTSHNMPESEVVKIHDARAQALFQTTAELVGQTRGRLGPLRENARAAAYRNAVITQWEEREMSLTERSITCRRVALTLGLAALMAVTASANQEALMQSVGDALTEVNTTKSQLAATMSSLNALLATRPGDDLRPAYQAYVENVDKTKQAAAITQQRVAQMNNDSANYFSSWSSDNEKISNPQVHKVATRRLEQVQKNYANAIASLQAAADKFTPFLSDLGDIQTALSNDLTAKGLKAAKGVLEKANHDHGEVQKEINNAIRHLTATQSGLSPVAGAK
jgi:hypothetical protein